MDLTEYVKECYRSFKGRDCLAITELPQSGSDRKYFRITESDTTIICAYNPSLEENDAFVGFTRHFQSLSLKVPTLLAYMPEKHLYFLSDLGDTTLYKLMHDGRNVPEFDDETIELYKQILNNLLLFQTNGINGLNLDLCYPHRSFDRQSVMWDMNYFKYMFLKLMAVSFNEKRLENDFVTLSDYILEAGQNYFLYRDFQSANIMIVGKFPYFIDYQGGRLGASQYDLASLLYDAKIPTKQHIRDSLAVYYAEIFSKKTGVTVNDFMKYYPAFCLIRLMQALGAFGFRGLYEKKPTFTESIVPGTKLLQHIALSATEQIALPELFSTIEKITSSTIYKTLLGSNK